jgi:hypothetical protein
MNDLAARLLDRSNLDKLAARRSRMREQDFEPVRAAPV